MTIHGKSRDSKVRRRRILLSAFACDPVTGSEPYVGWNWANELSKFHDVTLLTRAYSRKIINASDAPIPFSIISFDLPFCANKDHYWRFIKIYYIIWQILAPLKIILQHVRRPFDILHHLTYNVIDIPGFLWLVPGAKFVWGPVGGGQVPPATLKRVYQAGWTKQRFRAFLKSCARFNPLIRMAIARSSYVFFANKETSQLVSRYCSKWSILLETAINPTSSDEMSRNSRAGLNLLWLGNVIDRKALMIAIDSLAKFYDRWPKAHVKLLVAGDGPMLAKARRQAEELKIDQKVHFLGRVSFNEVPQLMVDADVFLFTSVQDTSGNVILEAMAAGTPVITLDHQGAHSIVDEQCGIRISIGTYDETTTRFASAIEKLLTTPGLLEAMQHEAVHTIRTKHSWPQRIAQYNEAINEIV